MTNAERIARLLPYRRQEVRNLVDISLRHRLVYVATPKAGCSTIKRTLQLLELRNDASRLPADVHNKATSPLKHPFSPGMKFLDLLAAPRTHIFCFVRNPYARFASAYVDKLLIGDPNNPSRLRIFTAMKLDSTRYITPADFLRRLKQTDPFDMDVHFAPQTYLLQPQSIPYSFIGRFETFEADLACALRGVPIVRMQQHEVHATSFVERLCAGPAAALIRQVYAKDFATFGYGADWRFA